MKLKLLSLAFLLLFLLLPSVLYSSEPSFEEKFLQWEVEKIAAQVELKQYMEENRILHQWRDLDNQNEKRRLLKDSQTKLKKYQKEKEKEKKVESTPESNRRRP